MYKLIFMTQAQKDAKNLASSGLNPNYALEIHKLAQIICQ